MKQDKKGNWAHKPFNLPSLSTEFKKTVVEAILTMARKQDKPFIKKRTQ
jgi:hypothetical protein